MEFAICLGLIYFSLICLLSLIYTIYDKYASIRRKRRIREKSLFLLAFIGGAISMYLSMLIIRHKTRHKRFMIGLPLIILFQFILVFFVYRCLV